MKTILVTSAKGGVGKTTTVLNLGYCLSIIGKRVLVFDGDPQGGISMSVNLRDKTLRGLINVIKKEAKLNEVILYAKNKNFGVLGIGNLESDDFECFEDEKQLELIKIVINKLKEFFDYIIIDSSYSMNSLLYTYMSVSDSVIIPTTLKILSIKSFPLVFKVMDKIRAEKNSGLALDGILITMYRGTEQEKNMLQELKKIIPEELIFKKMIAYSEDFETSNIKGVPQFLLSRNFDAKRDYFELALELLEREKNEEVDKDYAELF
ncbi:MAG: ParA family protein [Proteobacteria bacterium]|nr:ParA family protein [Pseudomonadota bacterium]